LENSDKHGPAPIASLHRWYSLPRAATGWMLLLVLGSLTAAFALAVFVVTTDDWGIWETNREVEGLDAHPLSATVEPSLGNNDADSLEWRNPDERLYWYENAAEVLVDGRLHVHFRRSGQHVHVVDLWIIFQRHGEPSVRGDVQWRQSSDSEIGTVDDLSGSVRMNANVLPQPRSEDKLSSPFVLEYELKGHPRSGPTELRGSVRL
jgi:hypothetical protein